MHGRNMDVPSDSGEDSDGNEECVIRNWRKWHKSQQDPLWPTSWSKGNKDKNKQMGPN